MKSMGGSTLDLGKDLDSGKQEEKVDPDSVYSSHFVVEPK